MARPKAKINIKELKKLAELQCTQEEIAAFFDVNVSTISRRFTKEIAEGREVGKISLRRRQFNLAKTNASMAIFLGKNWLGQRDMQEVDTGENLNEKLVAIANALKSHTNTEQIPAGRSQIHSITGGKAIKKNTDKQKKDVNKGT